MHPFTIGTSPDGDHWLHLATGTTPVDAAISAAGHEPNGPFWDGIADYLMEDQAPDLADCVDLNSEAGMFEALSDDRKALERLAGLMLPAATSPAVMTALIQRMDAEGYEFDD